MVCVRGVAVLIFCSLAACGDFHRDLRVPKTGRKASCSVQIMGDPVPETFKSYCDCMRDHIAKGYVQIGKAPPLSNMCPGLPD